MRSKKKFISLRELSQAGKMQMCEWLLGGLAFETVKQMAEKEFCLRLEENESMDDFWRDVCAPMLTEQRRRAAVIANEIAEDADACAIPFETATLAAMKQRAFEFIITPKLNPQMFRQVVGFIMKARDQELSRQRLRLMERRIEQASAVEDTVKDCSLTAESRERKLKEIFGLA